MNPQKDESSNELLTRRRWHRSCDKKASKVCKRACADAIKNVCSMYKCSKRMLRRRKNRCYRTCKSNFDTHKYSAE